MDREFVRVNQEGHRLHGHVCEVFGHDAADGSLHIQDSGSLLSGWVHPDYAQAIQRGTKVLIEVEISRLYEKEMLIPGGWMPLSRIRDVVSQPAVVIAESEPPFTGDPFLDYPDDLS